MNIKNESRGTTGCSRSLSVLVLIRGVDSKSRLRRKVYKPDITDSRDGR